MNARVGKLAPDFEVSAFHNGAIQKISLSDYRKKWVVLFFYPADFTFV
jgi:alkyl hydroperoxide reductase subunit AhpC